MYYPKSQIKTNLYTNGGEFVTETDGKPYKGYYFEVSNGEYYTGKTPQNPPNNPLVRQTGIVNSPQYPGTTVTGNEYYQKFPSAASPQEIGPQSGFSYYFYPEEYANAIDADSSINAPTGPIQVNPLPTKEDYELGEFQRYFLSKINENRVIEVNQKEYEKFSSQDNKVQWQLYIPLQMGWIIDGKMKEVFNINKNTALITQKSQGAKGFVASFRGQFLKYFKFKRGENLYTDGNEFLNARTKLPYKGYYHIHPTKGPMEGKYHVPQKHDFLVYTIPTTSSARTVGGNSSTRTIGGY